MTTCGAREAVGVEPPIVAAGDLEAQGVVVGGGAPHQDLQAVGRDEAAVGEAALRVPGRGCSAWRHRRRRSDEAQAARQVLDSDPIRLLRGVRDGGFELLELGAALRAAMTPLRQSREGALPAARLGEELLHVLLGGQARIELDLHLPFAIFRELAHPDRGGLVAEAMEVGAQQLGALAELKEALCGGQIGVEVAEELPLLLESPPQRVRELGFGRVSERAGLPGGDPGFEGLGEGAGGSGGASRKEKGGAAAAGAPPRLSGRV